MKLQKGTTVYIGRRKFTGEIPDAMAPKHLLEAQKKEDKKPPKKEGPVKGDGK